MTRVFIILAEEQLWEKLTTGHNDWLLRCSWESLHTFLWIVNKFRAASMPPMPSESGLCRRVFWSELCRWRQRREHNYLGHSKEVKKLATYASKNDQVMLGDSFSCSFLCTFKLTKNQIFYYWKILCIHFFMCLSGVPSGEFHMTKVSMSSLM